MGEFDGSEPKFEKISGMIDLGILQYCNAFRFFFGSSPNTPIIESSESNPHLGLSFFDPSQNCWIEPGFIHELPDNEKLPIDFILAQHRQGTIAFLPINRFGQISTLRSCQFLDNPLGLKILSGNYLSQGNNQFIAGGLISFGEDPITISKNIYHYYMTLINRSYALREYKEYPEPYEYIGFCTWNTFYGSVDMQSIKDLAEENFTDQPGSSGSSRFKYLIIDDGWQSINGMSIANDLESNLNITNRGLRYFEANKKFPNGLREISDLIKNKYNFQWVGVWHATFGYWNGVEPNTALGKNYPIIVRQKAGIPDPDGMKGYKFWHDYYQYIRSSGMDLLKIDNQSSAGQLLADYHPLDDIIDNYFDMQQGAAYSQNLKILNCMCMAPYIFTHWKNSNISRVSDDFSPGGFNQLQHQMQQCIFNPLFYHNFAWPDHDMFQTKQGRNGCPTWPLALLHAVSGGPVYIADEVGETDRSIIEKLSFEDGRIPRLNDVGLPTTDIIFADTDHTAPVKMWNYDDVQGWGRIFYLFIANMVKESHEISASFAIKNMGENRNVILTPKEEPTPHITKYLLKECESAITQVIESESTEISVDLSHFQAKYYEICPLLHGIAILGIKDVINGTKAINKTNWISEIECVIDFTYNGTFELYAETPANVIVKSLNGTLVDFKMNKDNLHILQIPITKNVKSIVISIRK
jgi:hypothetical protein